MILHNDGHNEIEGGAIPSRAVILPMEAHVILARLNQKVVFDALSSPCVLIEPDQYPVLTTPRPNLFSQYAADKDKNYSQTVRS